MAEPYFLSDEQRFTLYNFHRDEEVNRLLRILETPVGRYAPAVLLCGDANSGRRYFLECAMWRARTKGVVFEESRLDLTGFEPDQPACAERFVAHLMARREGKKRERAQAIVDFLFTRVQPKISASLGVIAAISILVEVGIRAADLAGLFRDTFERIPAMEGGGRELLHQFLRPLFQERRLILHVVESGSLPGLLHRWLTEEAEGEPNLTLVFSSSRRDGNWEVARDPPCERFEFTALDANEIETRLRERFGGTIQQVSRPLFDFSQGIPGLVARAVRELVTNGGLDCIEDEWRFAGTEHPGVLEVFSRSLYGQFTEVLVDLDDEESRLLKSFLFAAALCGEWFPVRAVLGFLGVAAEECDGLIERIDDLYASHFEDLGYSSSSMPGCLVYRFQNPLGPPVIRKHDREIEQRAARLAQYLEAGFHGRSREFSRMVLRIAQFADSPTQERVERTLFWLVAAEDADALSDHVRTELREGRVGASDTLVLAWRLRGSWHPVRIRALLRAIADNAADAGGFPFVRRELFFYWVAFGRVSLLLGDWLAAETQTAMALDLALGDLELAEAAFNQGTLYRWQGRDAEAEEFLARALGIYLETMAPGHIAATLRELGALYAHQSRYAEAEDFLTRALTIYEKTEGLEHPKTALTLIDFGCLRMNQARYTEAEVLLTRALAVFQNTTEPEHVDAARALFELGALRQLQDRYSEAEVLWTQAIPIIENTLGPKHPETATILLKLGELRRVQSRYSEAEHSLARALAILEDTMGPEHPHTARALFELGVVCHLQTRYTEAENFLLRALAIKDRTKAAVDSVAAGILHELGVLSRLQARYEQAQGFLTRALEIRKETDGAQDPNAAKTLYELGVLCQLIGRCAEALDFLTRALTIAEKVLGPGDPATAAIRLRIAKLQ